MGHSELGHGLPPPDWWLVAEGPKERDHVTLPGTNMEVESDPLEDHVPVQTGGFPLPC